MGDGAVWGVDLGDVRRTRRLVAMGALLAGSSGGTITGVTHKMSEAKAIYRLLDRPEVQHQTVIGGHVERVRKSCREAGTYLLIEDTTVVSLPGLKKSQGLGSIGEDYTRGFWLHQTLAVRWWREGSQDRVSLVGLLDQQAWARTPGTSHRGESKREQQSRERESQRWARVLAGERCPGGAVLWVYVADRESDIYEVFARCEAAGTCFVIRAGQDRALAQEDRHVFAAVAVAERLGVKTIEVKDHKTGKKRQAVLEVRAKPVELRGPSRPGGKLADRRLTAVEVREVGAPAGVEALHWVLLTDLEVDSEEEAWKVVGMYRQRWLVEEFHKALKTGLRLEESQLTTLRRLMALAGVLSVVATFLLDLKLRARASEDLPLTAQEADPAMLAVLEKTYGKPPRGWTSTGLLIAIAKYGGYPARKNDGPPGWLTIWRGWQRLLLIAEGFRLATQGRCGER
jgi:hypothetical protein